MDYPNLKIMQTFTEKNLPSLSVATLAALELFSKKGVSKIKNFNKKKRYLVVGSGNAISAAKVVFKDLDAIFANETNYNDYLQRTIDEVIVVSASGGKHAPIIAKDAVESKKKVTLLTCTKNSQAQKVVGVKNTIITHKIREPYTYNVSTYMGWILAKTKEDPKQILDFIRNEIDPVLNKKFKKYQGFLLVTPDDFSKVNALYEVKFMELFGRKVARDVKSFEELKHAITVVPNRKELCLRFGEGEVDFQNTILNIPLYDKINDGAMMAIGYYVIGKIQEQMPQYFKKNIKDYVIRNSNGSFGKVISVIVK